MSSTSLVAELACYQRTRFPLARFAPLSLFLALAAAATGEIPTLGLWLGRSLLVLPWLLQFRLADDLADLPRDRRDHPDRVHVRASPAPFVLLLVLLAAGNTLLAAWALSSLRWVEFLTLTGLLLIWYAVTHRYRPSLVLAGVPVLLKYPAFVYLLSDPAPKAGLLILVYACFLAYECLHDARLRTPTAQSLLALSLLTMTAAALLPVFASPEDWRPVCWLGPGCLVLAWLFRRHCRRDEPGVWTYGVFLIGCVWIIFAYLVPALPSRGRAQPMPTPSAAKPPDPGDFETAACFSCGADAAAPFIAAEDDLTGKPGRFHFVRCRRCGLVYQNPRLNVERIKDYYDDEYIAHRKKTRWGVLTPLYNRAMENHDRRKEQLVSNHVKLDRDSEVLDVGCGAGTFLRRLGRVHGARATGVDFKDLSMLPGFDELEFHCGLFYARDWGDRRFDLITMWHFLEHDYEPLRTLRLAESLLKPEGRLVVEVPRLDSVSFRLYRNRWPGLQAPQHTVLYSKETFLRCLTEAGLEVVEYLSYGAFPAYFYLFAGAAFKLLRGRGLNPSLAVYPYFLGQLLLSPVLLWERRLNLAMQTAVCRRPS